MSRIEQALEKAARLRAGMQTENTPQPADMSLRSAEADRQQCAEWYEAPAEPAVDISSPFLVAANSPSSQIAEEYRKLKSTIVRMTRGETFRNTLMVTSALGGEGKSITALNLAISLAQECDHTVLLIDADLRKPSLHRFFGLEEGPGLAECLVDGMEVGNALVKTGIGRLCFLPAGRRLDNPAEMLSSLKMRHLLAEMKHRYRDRYLVIDTPPVLPVAETRSLSSMVDGVVFVVREGVPSPDNIRDACTSLGVDKVMGLVYNDSISPGFSYRYGYPYYGGYGYRYHHQAPEGVEEKVAQRKGILKKIFRKKVDKLKG